MYKLTKTIRVSIVYKLTKTIRVSIVYKLTKTIRVSIVYELTKAIRVLVPSDADGGGGDFPTTLPAWLVPRGYHAHG